MNMRIAQNRSLITKWIRCQAIRMNNSSSDPMTAIYNCYQHTWIDFGTYGSSCLVEKLKTNWEDFTQPHSIFHSPFMLDYCDYVVKLKSQLITCSPKSVLHICPCLNLHQDYIDSTSNRKWYEILCECINILCMMDSSRIRRKSV